MRNKGVEFTRTTVSEIMIISLAVREILDLSLTAFLSDDLKTAYMVEPLEQVIDGLKEKLRTNHIFRLQQGDCSIDAGFIWSDLLTNLERTSDHCSNIAGTVIDFAHNNMNIHESLREFRNSSEDFRQKFKEYAGKYTLTSSQ